MVWVNSKLITNYRDKAKEVLSICNTLGNNDYPDWLLNKIKKEIKHKKVDKNDHISKEKCNYVGLPYFEDFTNVVSRILRKFNIGVYIYPHKTIRNILHQLKDSVDVIYKRGVIYKSPCKDCSGVKRVDYQKN